MKGRKTGWIKEATYDAKNPLMGEHQIHVDSHNVVTSLVEDGDSKKPRDGFHRPVIDFDFPCELIPSSTPGHFHLYIGRSLSWENYVELLNVMLKCSLIQRGWYDSAIREGQSIVRMPGVVKDDATRRILTEPQKIRLRELHSTFKILADEIAPDEPNPVEIFF